MKRAAAKPKKSAKKTVRKTAAKRAPASRRVTAGRQKKLVDKVILSIEDKVDADDFKASASDLLRLLEFRKDLEGREAKDIRVTWVDEKPREE